MMLLENVNKLFKFSPELYVDLKNAMADENIQKDEDLE